jgi:hypothetical protein
MVLNYLVFKEDLFAVKGGPNPGPRQVPKDMDYERLSEHNDLWGIFGSF